MASGARLAGFKLGRITSIMITGSTASRHDSVRTVLSDSFPQ